ncbi:glycine betaine/L-proline ABC transporter substrate-binding protein ProX [Roseofilum sp. BLCC_M91]|uniref:Glycine betaine/L-proline ABC transporter substrate-binding protein ProX n=1 Tax=Roseofilum halophilum BLCC-M91 TaxID=3022259 RepID=A0ABT7BS00_9CYAN|nr:glycine betaine/L-proline ABC transporter substrate-binding protein ProX [Roseofilum halophilum]MDJ1181537.1 glycine betaine/L-proline ABC transporter substrate-binding protein ProX [Roseofilum halophilum BLCC-M91]
MKTPSSFQFIFLPTLISLMMGLISCQPTQQSSEDPSPQQVTIRAAQSTWVEETFQNELVSIGLEQLGYQIAPPREVDYPAIYLSLANNDLDYSVIYYNPQHEGLFANAGGEEKMELLGVLVPFGEAGYRIDKKTAEEYGISSIEQLKDPEIAKLFDFDGDGKANLTGCNPGWACELIVEHHIEAYGLQDTVEQDQGQYVTLLADTIARYKQGGSILYYAYNPHWIFAVLKPNQDTVWLTVPFTSLPESQGEVTEAETTVDGKNLGISKTGQNIVASQTFVERNPMAKRWLELVQIPVQDMNQISLRIKDGENSPEDIRRLAEEWIGENQEQFDGWLAEAKIAGE